MEHEADMMKRLLSRTSFDAESQEALLEKQPKQRQFLLGYPGTDLTYIYLGIIIAKSPEKVH